MTNQEFTTLLSSSFENSGYRIEVEQDMEEFAELRKSTPDHAMLVPAFDYQKSDQSNSRWLRVSDKKGNLACIGAFKSFETNNLHSLISTGKIWYDNPPFDPYEILCDTSQVVGKCYYRGGMYVYPGHNKTGLPWGLATYAQAIAVTEGIDWIVGQAFKEIVDTGIPSHAYGFETIDLQYQLTGHCPLKGPLGADKCLFYLLTCSRSHFINNIGRAWDILISCRDKKLIDAAREYKRVYYAEKRPRIAA